MTYVLGKTSLAKLEGVHPDLVKVVKLAITLSTQDFSVLEGARTKTRQAELYAQGRTKPGSIVTWTMKSNHIAKSDGLGQAVDLVPYPLDWNTLSKFNAISEAMTKASKQLGIPIRWGADWDSDGRPRERGETDSPHFELGK